MDEKDEKNDRPIVAHVNGSNGRDHLLEDHLREVGKLASSFAAKYGSGDWGRVAGLWHDLGKYRAEFQKMIREANDPENAHVEETEERGTAGKKVDHSSAGAIFALEQLGDNMGLPLALVIAGHHAGLKDKADWEDRRCDAAKKCGAFLQPAQVAQVPKDIVGARTLTLPLVVTSAEKDRKKLRFEFWIRILFSALVDADFLDTAAFFKPAEQDLRGDFPPVSDLAARLRTFMEQKSAEADNTVVNQLRRRILERCHSKAGDRPGVFRLTVPTGGGKTLASLSFALEHAVRHGLDRVIVVAPFLTVIDQTVRSFREALGETPEQPCLIEHHSGVDIERANARNRLASENWDAPLVVTTAVQFYESLFARRTSQCRKLHNIARSVIIIDEIQTLPNDYAIPVLDVLQTLVDGYDVSIILSSATQPDLEERKAPDGRRVEGFRQGSIREIAGTPEEIAQSFNNLKRVRTERVQTKSWDEVAGLVAAEKSVLAITHLRNDARELAERVEQLTGDKVYHLSALMCGRHRQERIQEIKGKLQDGESIRVVSTQLVEAGVDLDFPVVFRAMAGFDSLIQSAGRCNREGRLPFGRLVIYDAPTKPPVGWLRTAADRAASEFKGAPDLDLFNPDVYRAFHCKLGAVADKHGIQNLREELAYEKITNAFQIIDDGWQVPVIVRWGEAPDLLGRADSTDNPHELRRIARQLQPYSVSISRKLADNWLKKGVLRLIAGMFLSPALEYRDIYSKDFGLLVDKMDPAADPNALIG